MLLLLFYSCRFFYHHKQLKFLPQYKFNPVIAPTLHQQGNDEKIHAFREHLEYERGGRRYIPVLVKSHLELIVSISVTLYSSMTQHRLVHTGGDLDNRAKTLLDSLRLPSASEAVNSWYPEDGEPCWVLLEDDSMIRNLSIKQEQILGEINSREVLALIEVEALL